MPPVRMTGDGRKARDPKKTLGRLLKYLMLYKARIIIVLLCIFAFSPYRAEHSNIQRRTILWLKN